MLGGARFRVLRGEDEGAGAADRLPLLVAEDALGPRVSANDAPLGVHHEDGVVLDVLDQEAEALLAASGASVSEVASRLQKAGLISYERGNVAILDRSGLETKSCECYRIIEEEFDSLLD